MIDFERALPCGLLGFVLHASRTTKPMVKRCCSLYRDGVWPIRSTVFFDMAQALVVLLSMTSVPSDSATPTRLVSAFCFDS